MSLILRTIFRLYSLLMSSALQGKSQSCFTGMGNEADTTSCYPTSILSLFPEESPKQLLLLVQSLGPLSDCCRHLSFCKHFIISCLQLEVFLGFLGKCCFPDVDVVPSCPSFSLPGIWIGGWWWHSQVLTLVQPQEEPYSESI